MQHRTQKYLDKNIPILYLRARATAIRSESLTIVNTSRPAINDLDVTIEITGIGCNVNGPLNYKRIKPWFTEKSGILYESEWMNEDYLPVEIPSTQPQIFGATMTSLLDR